MTIFFPIKAFHQFVSTLHRHSMINAEKPITSMYTSMKHHLPKKD